MHYRLGADKKRQYLMEHIIHPWKPIHNTESKVLILGTIPSPKSREAGFYFGHPQNIFWKILAESICQPVPASEISAKKQFLLQNNIALWDVLHACDINGASDLSIKNPVPNKFRPLIAQTKIRAIFTTGKKATELFNTLCTKEVGMEAIYLPSTSPANRATHAKPAFKEAWEQVGKLLL